MKKKYRQPRIKAIELTPDQAILNVCAVGGIWFNFVFDNYCVIVGGANTTVITNSICSSPVRGQSDATMTPAADNSYVPS